jgi:thiosulfate/3-mercaptopyruvate sulfurtransferase
VARVSALPPIVDVAWLSAHRADVVLADVRWYLDGRSGQAGYLEGHLPGAVWVDLDAVLAGPPGALEGRHPIPPPAAFAAGLGAVGIGPDRPVIAYDDSGDAYAARLVWLLRRIGQPAALLDGGLASWPGSLETGPVVPEPVARPTVEWPEGLFRSADEVAAAAGGGGPVVLDARAADRFAGVTALPTDARAGHIHGARNAPWADNLDADGRFSAPAALARRYESLGVTRDSEVIVYCGSGVTACHDLLALESIGVERAALYPGSWSAWAADARRPIASGPDEVAGPDR